MDFEEEEKIHTQKEKRKSIAKQRTLFKSKYKIIFINKKKKKNWKINVYIFVLNKKQNRDIKPWKRTIERTRKVKNKKTLEYVQLRK